MGIGNLTKKRAGTVMGIDASTKSLAFALFDHGKPVRCGEILFEGATVFERLKDAKQKVGALVDAGVLRADYIGIESAIMVRDVQVAIDMAYVFGAIIGELMAFNPEVHKVAPISWQAGIGVPNLKKEEKEMLRKQHPDRKPSWYQNEGRKIRKARILKVARQYFQIPDGSDNAGDAVGIALHITKSLTRTP